MATKKDIIEQTDIVESKPSIIVWNGSLALVEEYKMQGYDARLSTPEELQAKILENQAFLEAIK